MRTVEELLNELSVDHLPSTGDTVSFNALPEATGVVECFVNSGSSLYVRLAGTGQKVSVPANQVTLVKRAER